MYNLLNRLPETHYRLPPTLSALLRDPLVWPPVVTALLVNLGLVGFLWIQVMNLNAQFSGVIPVLPMHFDAAGQPDRIEPATAIYSLPLIGLIVLGANVLLSSLIYRREPMASYLLIGVALLLQFVLWFAAITILRTLSL